MKKIPLKKKIIFTAIISPLMVVFIVFYIVMPTVKDITEMKNGIEAQKLDLERKYQKGQNLKHLNESLNTIEPQLEKMNSLFIKRDKVLEFITTMEGIAGKNGVEQKINLDLNMGVDENGYKKTPIQITTEGKFMNQLKYLTNLEALNYYINIKSLSLSSRSQESQGRSDNIGLMFFADTFWK